MNSIVFTHVFAPDGLPSLDTALDRLGAYLDAELGSLEDLLDIAGHEDAIDDIGALHRLHLDSDAAPKDVRRLLEGALVPLERLHERVETIPLDGALTGAAPSDFDAWVCWSGARLKDILATLRRALAA